LGLRQNFFAVPACCRVDRCFGGQALRPCVFAVFDEGNIWLSLQATITVSKKPGTVNWEQRTGNICELLLTVRTKSGSHPFKFMEFPPENIFHSVTPMV
jgi:hypothetical protein